MATEDGSIGATETKGVTISDPQEVTVPLVDQEEGKSTILSVGTLGMGGEVVWCESAEVNYGFDVADLSFRHVAGRLSFCVFPRWVF